MSSSKANKEGIKIRLKDGIAKMWLYVEATLNCLSKSAVQWTQQSIDGTLGPQAASSQQPWARRHSHSCSCLWGSITNRDSSPPPRPLLQG